MTPLERLAQWLGTYHPNYTTADVALSRVKGYLWCTKRCPSAGKTWMCKFEPHYHTLGIAGVGYPDRDERGRFTSPYRLWRELHGLLPQAEEVA